jgi:hypothetical protein
VCGGRDPRRRFRQGLQPGKHIRQRTHPLFHRPPDQFDGAGIQPGAGHLNKPAAGGTRVLPEFDAREVYRGLAAPPDYLPCRPKLLRNPKLARKDVDSAQGEDPKAGAQQTVGAIGNAGDHPCRLPSPPAATTTS